MYNTETIRNLGLKDIHVGNLPTSIGTYLGYILFVIFVLIVIYLLVRHLCPIFKDMYLLVVKFIKSDNFAIDMSKILKNSALRYYSKEQISSLAGQEWIEFLDKQGHTKFMKIVHDWNALLYGNDVITSNEKAALFRNGLLWLCTNIWRTPWSK